MAIEHQIREKIHWLADANLLIEHIKTEIVTLGCKIEPIKMVETKKENQSKRRVVIFGTVIHSNEKQSRMVDIKCLSIREKTIKKNTMLR